MQTTNHLLLIKPASFAFNAETAASNGFQKAVQNNSIQLEALKEFELFESTLKANGLNVLVFDDTLEPAKPDAIFPNNWISFHADGTVVLYPMLAPNRRIERRMDIVDSLKQKFNITNVIDLSPHEQENKFLEGTGSIVFDHVNKIAYASLSPRTHKELLLELASKINYTPIYFSSFDQDRKEIYHTNVMMCIGKGFVVACLGAVQNPKEKSILNDQFNKSGLELIEITLEQMNHFAGNMLAVHSKTKDLLILSQTAMNRLTGIQRKVLEKYVTLLPLSINTIETAGGGSARCMIAEIFCQKI